MGFRRVCGAFLQVAVLPADSGVYGVTPGSSVSVGVPAQIPPEVPVEGEDLESQDSSSVGEFLLYTILRASPITCTFLS